MSRQNVELLAFNRGVISDLALARVDLPRTALSASEQTNWMPRTLGSMMLRPGLEYIGQTYENHIARYIPFVFSADDCALIELTSGMMRVWRNDEVITRVAVSSAVTNGSFDSDVSGWSDYDDAGASSTWVSGGYMGLSGNGFAVAERRQQVVVAAEDEGVEHALNISVARGPVRLRVGSTITRDDFVRETVLGVGSHSITFTPTGSDFWIQLLNERKAISLISSVSVAAAGEMTFTTPWASTEIPLVRYDQSGDVVYLACEGEQQYKIERRSATSWSLVRYMPEDGPFFTYNQTGIRFTPTDISGDITVTSSGRFFKEEHIRALFRIDSVGQRVDLDISAEDQWTGDIRVTGIGDSRKFAITLSGTWSGTVTLQRSIGETGAWVDVTTYTSNTTTTYDDELDNYVAYYRIGIKTGGYTSGTVTAALEFEGGSTTGIFRVTGYVSDTEVTAAVLVDLGGTDATSAWAEGMWSDYRGWPSCVAIYEGRLWWAGKDKVWGSVSDDYESFNDEVVGDSATISRSIGTGTVDVINWLAPVSRLLVGNDARVMSAKSSSFDEPLTATNFNLKSISSQGTDKVACAILDKSVLFVQRSGSRLYQLGFDIQENEYSPGDLMALIPDIGQPGIIKVAIQTQPDTRVHCVRSDGKVAILVSEVVENVRCWVLFETDGIVEDCVVLPGTEEDAVYYLVSRSINGSTVRYLEKWALESEAVGGTINKQADAFLQYSGSATTTITGLSHLEGETVCVWAAGKDLGTYTVSGGQITGLSQSVTSAVVGLVYRARFKSTKLAYGAQLGSSLVQPKRINQLGVILKDAHYQGLSYGPDFDNLDELPLTSGWSDIADDTVHSVFDEAAFEFPGTWDTDSRLCLEATAPRPCTVLACVVGLDTHDKS